jgi:hypothetical protein
MRDVKGFVFIGVCLLVLAVFVVKVCVPVVNTIAPVAKCQKVK